jgi:ferritin-like metal-binding protein YciE
VHESSGNRQFEEEQKSSTSVRAGRRARALKGWLLQQTLDEEERTDKKLSQLAESIVNVEALQEA